MKITRVESYLPRQPEVKFQCDSGQNAAPRACGNRRRHHGIGEVDSAPMAVKRRHRRPFSHTTAAGLASIVVGEILRNRKDLAQMYRANILPAAATRRRVHAMSGIRPGALDIKGKALKMPVWKLLGGGFHQKIALLRELAIGATPEKTGEMAPPPAATRASLRQIRLGPMARTKDRYRAGA